MPLGIIGEGFCFEGEGGIVSVGEVAVDAEVARRKWLVAEAVHNGLMEGFIPTPDTVKDTDDYIAGIIDSEELEQRVLARYGLV